MHDVDGLDIDHLLRTSVDVIAEGLIVVDADGDIRLFNRSAETIMGITADQARDEMSVYPGGYVVSESGRLVDAGRDPLALALATGAPQQDKVVGIRRPDGTIRWLLVNAQPLCPPGAQTPAAALATVVDITARLDSDRRMSTQIEQIRCLNSVLEFQMGELKRANAQLEELAALDSLTGLNNHRSFHERLSEEFARATRHGAPLSIILLDVDHFKLYNDTFGHLAGDLVLRKIAQLMQLNARASDVVARVAGSDSATQQPQAVIARHGGEEFSVILPCTDGPGAVRVAERLRIAIQSAEWENRPITASFGVATLVPSMVDPDGLIAAADKALYRSKTCGRNRVTSAACLGPRG